MWRVRVGGSGQYSVSVRAKSELELLSFDFVRVGGRPGHEGLFPIQGQPTSPDQIVRALVDLLRDAELRTRMERLGLQRSSYFSWQETARQMLGVFHEVADGQPAARAAVSPSFARR